MAQKIRVAVLEPLGKNPKLCWMCPCSGSTSFTAGSSSPGAVAAWICLPVIFLIEHRLGAQKRAGEVFGLPV